MNCSFRFGSVSQFVNADPWSTRTKSVPPSPRDPYDSTTSRVRPVDTVTIMWNDWREPIFSVCTRRQIFCSISSSTGKSCASQCLRGTPHIPLSAASTRNLHGHCLCMRRCKITPERAKSPPTVAGGALMRPRHRAPPHVTGCLSGRPKTGRPNPPPI